MTNSHNSHTNTNSAYVQPTNIQYGVTDEPDNLYDQACRSDICERIKLVVATGAVSLLILVALVGIAMGYCVLETHPAINFCILVFCITLLAYVEALHYACVAIEKWDMSQYQDRFPRAVRCHKYVDDPEKVKRFLVGRQFFVIFVVFLLAQITTFPRKLYYIYLILQSIL
jgi:hypothetical protein